MSGLGCVADGDGDAPSQLAQGPINSCSLGAVLRIQHPPHLALGNVEIASKAALRDPGLTPRLVKGRLQRDLQRRNHQGPPTAGARWFGQVRALPNRGCDELAQQVLGFGQRLVPGGTVRDAPPEIRERDDEPAVWS